MKCDECGNKYSQRRATRSKPYAYSESGLSDVLLIGVTVYRCEACAVESAVIPRVEELHECMVRSLVAKPTLLNGEEVRFLRKHAGLKSAEFAALIGQTPENVSRVENGRQKSLNRSADKLVRAIIHAAINSPAVKDVLLEAAVEIEDIQRRQKARFLIKGQHWQLAA